MPYLLNNPIIIAPYDPQWPAWYEAEQRRLADVLAPVAFQLEHIGSTSVPGLAAKVILDISASVRALEDTDVLVDPLRGLGYEDAKINPVFQRRMFSRGPWQEAGSVHLHFTGHGSDTWAEPILMRDYLRVHPEDAAWYAGVKQASAAAHGSDLNGYHEGKGECVLTLIRRARAWQSSVSG